MMPLASVGVRGEWFKLDDGLKALLGLWMKG